MEGDEIDMPKRTWNPESRPTKERSESRVSELQTPDWRKEPKPPAVSRYHRIHNIKIYSGFLGAAVTLGLLIWVSTWFLPPRGAHLFLLGAGYQKNLAVSPNCYGWNNLEKIYDTLKDGQPIFLWKVGQLRIGQQPRLLQGDGKWYSSITENPGKTVVLYISAHGGSDNQGPYLLTQDATRENTPENRIRIYSPPAPPGPPGSVPPQNNSVLARLAALPEGVNKVLIIDATQVEANWGLGILRNSFVDEIAALEDQIVAIPNLVVICSSGPNQRSWPSPDWQETFFGHYLLEALRGGSDTTGDGRINAWELYSWVKSQVEVAVWNNRQSYQSPVIFPSGGLGQSRAQQIAITMVPSNYVPEDPRNAPQFTPPPELETAWQTYQQLASQLPPPSAYSPQLWREYIDTLLRYDELVRRGDQVNSSDLLILMAELQQDINQNRTLTLSSAQNSLEMPAVAGLSPTPQTDWTDEWNKIWNADPKDLPKIWDATSKQVLASADAQIVQMNFFDYLLQNAAGLPISNLHKAASLIDLVRDPRFPLPFQMHYLQMLSKYLPAQLPSNELADLPQQSLLLALFADQAALGIDPNSTGYPYCEWVHSWGARFVEQGNKSRLLGEDLLFTGDPVSWQQAEQNFQAARSQYGNSLQVTGVVQKALATRDLVMPMLPYYSQWIAHRQYSANAQEQRDAEAQMREVSDLWQKVHQLAELLETAGPVPQPGTAPEQAISEQIQQLAGLSTDIHQSYQKIEQSYQDYWTDLSNVDSPTLFFEAQAALEVPFPDPQLRLQLINYMCKTSRDLLLSAATSNVVPPSDAKEYVRNAAMFWARRQGLMALATLGTKWFAACPGDNLETYDQVTRRLNTFQVDTQWWKSLTAAGQQVAIRIQQMPLVINTLQENFRKQDMTAAAASLQQADLLSRLLDGTGAGDLTAANSPAQDYRYWLVRELVLWQAKQTFAAHWFSLDPNSEPYYRFAGLVYLDDAWRFAASDGAQKEVRVVQQMINQPSELSLTGPQEIVVTSEQQFTSEYSVATSSGEQQIPGYPTMWAKTGNNVQLVFPIAGQRFVRSVGISPDPSIISCTLTSPLVGQSEANGGPIPGPNWTNMTLSGFFRGQNLESSTRINLYTLADTVQYLPQLPNSASLAVRADQSVWDRFGASNAGLAIVLDCSGSMAPANGVYDNNAKYVEATNALQTVLQRIPRGTQISIWVFGQAVGSARTVPASQTIQQVVPPTTWNPASATQLQSIMSKVQYPALIPWNESPIVQTMLAAKGDLINIGGFKTMLVLTDGMDNQFAQNSALNPGGLSIPQFLLQQFQNSGIEVNVVGFKVVNAEEEAAQAQFEVVQDFEIPGRWYSVSQAENLVDTLDLAMRQKLRYWVLLPDGNYAPGCPPSGLDASHKDYNNQWFPGGLAPGVYTVRVKAEQLIDRTVILNRGDLLLIDLVTGANGTEFQRGIYSKEDFSWKPAVEQSGWRMAALQNQAVGDQSLQMLMTMEQVENSSQITMQQQTPREVWMTVAPAQQASSNFALVWGVQPGYPAPAWNLFVPQWPTIAGTGTLNRPVVSVWWNPNQESPAAATLEQGSDFQSYLNILNRKLRIDDGDIEIESVSVEQHLVTVTAGQPKQSQPCLVVRVRYAANQPVWIRPRGIDRSGFEHRFYNGVNRYTGLFWPINADQAQTSLSSLSVISLQDFLDTASARQFQMQLNNLPTPDTSDVRPVPPTNLE